MHRRNFPASSSVPSNGARRAGAALLFLTALVAPGCATEPCTIRDDGDGTQTLVCGSREVAIGSSCTATDNADGTQTIACADGTEVTVGDGVSCTLDDGGDGTVTFSCADGTEWTFAPGCTNRVLELATHDVVVADCPDGASYPLKWHWKRTPTPLLSVGFEHICGVRSNGAIHCWGYDESGNTESPFSIYTYVQVATGRVHTCALTDHGAVFCSGSNSHGQTVHHASDGPFVQVVAGEYHTCALRANGSVVCWGYDEYVDWPDDDTFAQLAAGDHFTCGLRPDGTVSCWGNSFGGSELLTQGDRFVQIDAGSMHACGLRADGTMKCWGDNSKGQRNVPLDERFIQITAGGAHSCGLREDRSATCWGENYYGQSTAPEGETFVQVDAGEYNTCGVRADGTAMCWGDAASGKTEPQWPFHCRPADDVDTPTPGLSYQSWSYVGSSLPDFGALGAPSASGALATVGLPSAGDDFAMRLTGYVYVPEDGMTTFGLTSDAGSRLVIGGDEIIDHDGLHTASTRRESLCLDAGWHAITIEYFEAKGEETLGLSMGASVDDLAPVPAESLGYVP